MKKGWASAEAGPSHRAVEIGVALATTGFAVLVIVGSLRAGINWGAEGPRAGFFPFYIALFILLASMVNLFSAIHGYAARKAVRRMGPTCCACSR